MSLFRELQRRNVIRVATAYVVAAWLIIQVVETLFPVFGLSNESIRLVVILLAVGFLPAVVGAWVFQFTPTGLERDSSEAPVAPSKSASRTLDRSIIVILALGLSYFALDKFVFAPAPENEGFYGSRSVAVVPFRNMSANPEHEFFAEGVAEDIRDLLARIRQLRVISSSSSFAFRGQNLGIAETATRLGVAHILEGSVRTAGNRVKVTAKLIEARTDTTLWSDTYERDLKDVFRIQDEIAADVAKNLQITLLEPLPASRYVDPEVRSLTQQAKLLSETRPAGVGEKMYALLSRALEIDPYYVPALNWMITADYFRVREGLVSKEEERQRYEQIAERLRQADPNAIHVHTKEAWDRMREGRLEEAAELYLGVLAKDMSDSNVVRLSGMFARNIGKFESSARLLEHAVAIDPLCYMCLYQLSRTYLVMGDYDRALQIRERYVAIGTGGDYHHGLMLLLQGKAQEALDHFTSFAEDYPFVHAGIAMAWFSLGDREKADAELARLVTVDSERVDFYVADVAAWMGEADAAFEALNRVLERRPDEIDIFLPIFRSLWNDPRWPELRESLGRSAARFAAIEFDPVMPE